MSEEKIIQHTGKAAGALLKRNSNWKKKLQEFLFEILIIVIAVSITLWFHNWNDRIHEEHLANNFLIGIRGDLKSTADKLEIDIAHYQHTLDYYETAWKQIRENRVNAGLLDSGSGNLTNMVSFAFDNSRFQSFSYSGNLRLMENRRLMQDLTRMYTVTLPERQQTDHNIFAERRNQFITYIGSKAPIDEKGNSRISGLINDPAVKFQIMWQGALLEEMKRQKLQLIKDIRQLAGQIDSELKDH